MNFDGWIDSYKVYICPWIDKKRIYCNVQYFRPGQSVQQAPVWDKTVYLVDNEAGRNLLVNFRHSFINHIANMQIKEGTEVTFTA